MARKIDPNAKPKPTPAATDDGADDLDILHPDVTLPIAGREITVREYGFVAGLRVRVRAKGFIDALRQQIESGSALLEEMQDVIATHWDLVRELVAESAEVEIDWIDGLNDADGELLLLTWWGVCGPFFVRMIARRISQGIQLQAALAGPISTPDSPPQATAAPTVSAATRSVN